MSRWRHGLIVGKLRPPHKGQGYLIESALTQVDRLTVVVCEREGDPIPGELRAGWLRELYPTVDVRVWVCDGYDSADSALWARLTREWLGETPDVVFTSEAYGET